MATIVNIPILLFLLATTTINSINSYKILIYLPQFGHSHITFAGKIADALAEAGNDVLVLIPRVDPELHWSVGAKIAKTRIFGNFTAPEVIAPINQQIENAWTSDGQSVFTGISLLGTLLQLAYGSCKEQLEHPEIIEQLKREKYDLAIGEFFNPCGFGLFELANIPAHILTSSSLLAEGLTDIMGVPNAISYVPTGFAATTDRMTYTERVGNLMKFLVSRLFVKTLIPSYLNSLYRNKFGNDFIDIAEKMSQSSFMFVNSNEYLEYPRPISHRIIYIGGIGLIEPKPLDKTFSKIVDDAQDGVILMSFGSVANSYQMPDKMKRALLTAFAQFPRLTFIWKYEKDDEKLVQGYSNVHISKWIPQVDLLNHSKVLAFITHGGAGSVSESIRYATPMICIPLFADQPRNAKLAEYRNIAIVLDKHNITVESVSEAIREILSNNKYQNSVKRLSRMMQSKPTTPLESVVKYSEFAAEFGRIENLEPYGLHMGYIEYFLIDIIVPAILFILLIGYIFVKISIWIVYSVASKLMTTNKSKNE